MKKHQDDVPQNNHGTTKSNSNTDLYLFFFNYTATTQIYTLSLHDALPIFDVILGGHEHEPLVAEEGKAVITKAGSDARYLVEVDVWLRPDGALVERSWTFHEVSARLPEDPDVAAVVRDYETRLGRELAIEIGRTTVPLEARRAPLRTE